MPQYAPANLDILRRTTRADFFAQLASSQQERIFSLIAMDVDSDSDQEVYAFFGAIPKPVRVDRAGGGIEEESMLQDYSKTVVNATWKMHLPIARSVFEDAKLNQVSVRAKQQGDSAMMFMDERMTTVIEANGNSYDGIAFFGANHDGGTGAFHDNDITFNVTTPDAPTVTEFEDAFAEGLETYRLLEDDQNRKINGSDQLVCMVPANMERVARSILEIGPVAGQTGNSGVFKGIAKVAVNPFIAAATNERFFIFGVSAPIKPILYQKREEWEYKLITSGDDWDKKDLGAMVTRGRWDFSGGDHKKAVRVVLT